MSVKWTEEQQKVIDVRGKNVLVSAAAGSGKTAVLVERILSLVCGDREGEAPVDVDRLLVVTFTKAAAAEMRERVGLALQKRLEADPENEHLQKQQTLIHTAQITTIDSFCQYVIRNYFHQIDLDPSFRIGDEGELKLLKGDVVKELLEAHYAAEDEAERARFTAFVEAYATGKSDAGLEDLILQVYEYAVSYPYPKRWLEDCRRACRAEDARDLEDSAWLRFLLGLAAQTFAGFAQELRGLLELCAEPDGPYMYADALRSDLELTEELALCRDYEAIRRGLSELSFARLSAKKDEAVDEGKREQVKRFREGFKKSLKALKDRYFALPLAAAADLLKKAAPTTEELLTLTAEFADRYQEKKRQKNLADFPDLEHLALEILVADVREEDGRLTPVPTEAARELASRYVQIMIDEYQDSNLIQEILLQSLSGGQGKPNVFLVGDVKQSIYRFRLARPELFLEKYHSYPLTDEAGAANIRIDLHKNFRSRKEVLGAVNGVFARLMTEAVGGIRYDEAAALYLGAELPEPPEAAEESGSSPAVGDLTLEPDAAQEYSRNVPELLLLEKDARTEAADEDEAERTDRELEAQAAADRIRQLLRENQIWDAKQGAFRPVRYGDIVILLRSLTGWGDVYARVLTAAGIPAHTESRTGYFTTIEIQTLLNLLRVLDNPRQDIPLAAVLKSMIGGFSDTELALIKSAFPKEPFHEACRRYARFGETAQAQETAGAGMEASIRPELAAKLAAFYGKLRIWRQRAEYLPIHELIEELLDDTGYGDYLAAQPGGEQREANVRMLIARALAFEKTSYRGLFHFVRYIGQLQSYNEDFGEAGVLGENEDAVRILTIHKSKGLEFPIVIVAGLGKGFNRQDTRSRVIIHPDLGLGVDYVDPERRTKTATLQKRVLQRALDLEMLGEELRVLYVAFTRAKEKLILLGSASKLAQKLENGRPGSGALPFQTLAAAGTYLDWLLPAVAAGNGADSSPLGEAGGFLLRVVRPAQQAEEAIARGIGRAEQAARLAHPEDWPEADPAYEKALQERLSYVYPYEQEVGLRGKFSVSELKYAGQLEEEDEDTQIYPLEEQPGRAEAQAGEALGGDPFREPDVVPYIPRFMQAEVPLSGAARGTAYHRALECLDFTRLTHSRRVSEELARLVREGRMTQEQADAIRPYDLYAFAQSALARRMTQARLHGNFHTEQPFVLRLRAADLDIGCDSGEPVLVQGIIDAYFTEENDAGEPEIVVVDYKTDYVKSGGELLRRYKKQLDYYALALERLTGLRVKEKVIYSFALQEEVRA